MIALTSDSALCQAWPSNIIRFVQNSEVEIFYGDSVKRVLVDTYTVKVIAVQLLGTIYNRQKLRRQLHCQELHDT